jgi:hypothetical protein
MVENKAGGAAGNTALDAPHDKVAMLSLNADGSPRDHNPEIIGDKDAALAATREQFAQQAVSAVDRTERATATDDGVDKLTQDPVIAALQDKHDGAVRAAVSAADSTVGVLFAKDQPSPAAPAKESPSK